MANTASQSPIEKCSAVSLRGIHKRYGATVALDGVNLDVAKGEIHALLGENGAGKSTLMNVLYGLTQPDSGEIRMAGGVRVLRSPNDAKSLGIGMVHQHFMLVPNLSVAENLFLGEGLQNARGPWFTRRRAFAAAREAANQYKIQIDVTSRVDRLSVGEQQRVELLKALHGGARILILDEPTAVLAPREIDELFEVMNSIREGGRSIIFITHKLEEVKRICDRVTVLRQGRVAGKRNRDEIDPHDLGELMVGEALEDWPAHARRVETTRPVLSIRSLASANARLLDASFNVESGEILAIAGVEGNGQGELARLIAGIELPARGSIEMNGRDLAGHGPNVRIEEGLGFVPGDRRVEGLAMDFSIEENLAMKHYRRPPYAALKIQRKTARSRRAISLIEKHDIRAASPFASAGSLSGGNQQKVVLARELDAMKTALAAMNPTRGLDVGAARVVHEELIAARRLGAAILLITTELDEAIALADRLAVLYKGSLSFVDGPPFDRTAVGRRMLGEAGGGP